MLQLSTILINQSCQKHPTTSNSSNFRTSTTTCSKRLRELLLNLTLRNCYLALQPGLHVRMEHFFHWPDLRIKRRRFGFSWFFGLTSSERIEGNTGPSDSATSASFSSRSCPSLTISSGLLAAYFGRLCGAAASLAFCWSMRCWDTSCSTTSATLRASWKCDLAFQFKPIQK